MAIQTVTFVVNAHRKEAIRLLSELSSTLADRGLRSLTEEFVGKPLGLPWAPMEALAECDLCISLGGDGTLAFASLSPFFE